MRAMVAEAIHSLTPHGTLHSFEGCPQRGWDEQEADDLIAALERRGASIVPSEVAPSAHIESSVSE